MINSQMKPYKYYLYSEELNEYGESTPSLTTLGTVKMAINLLTQEIVNSAIYKDATYVGLTFDKSVKESYLIEYGEEKLKVLYVNDIGRYKQVFLQRV